MVENGDGSRHAATWSAVADFHESGFARNLVMWSRVDQCTIGSSALLTWLIDPSSELTQLSHLAKPPQDEKDVSFLDRRHEIVNEFLERVHRVREEADEWTERNAGDLWQRSELERPTRGIGADDVRRLEVCPCDVGSGVWEYGKRREIRGIGSELNISRIVHLVRDHRHRWCCGAPDTLPPRLTDGGQKARDTADLTSGGRKRLLQLKVRGPSAHLRPFARKPKPD